MRSACGGLAHPCEQCMEAACVRSRGRPAGEASSEAAAASAEAREQARAYATWARLEREFALGERGGRRLLLPRHSRERFLELLEWMACDEGRRELIPVVLYASGLFTRETGLTQWGVDPAVLARLGWLLGRRRAP